MAREMRYPTVDWQDVSLLGIDVGFSKTNATTGVAVYERGALRSLCCVQSSPEDRAAVLRRDFKFDAVAIDGPILPRLADFKLKRYCESLLIGRGFHNRCKPGMSHHGSGLDLRAATRPIADESCLLTKTVSKPFGDRQVRFSIPLVEAFPNAFLGVLLDDIDYEEMGRVSRGARFDRLYERAVVTGRTAVLFDQLGWECPEICNAIKNEVSKNGRAAHEKRAALVCLLTAACALAGKAEYVGDTAGGWICLPPKELWARWAHQALETRKMKLECRSNKDVDGRDNHGHHALD
jgi:hypothetical protein